MCEFYVKILNWLVLYKISSNYWYYCFDNVTLCFCVQELTICFALWLDTHFSIVVTLRYSYIKGLELNWEFEKKILLWCLRSWPATEFLPEYCIILDDSIKKCLNRFFLDVVNLAGCDFAILTTDWFELFFL